MKYFLLLKIIIFFLIVIEVSFSWFNPILSQARSFIVTTTVKNFSIFAGGCFRSVSSYGYCINGTSNRLDIYNYSSNSWLKTHMSQARTLFTATSVENLALFAGGNNNTGATPLIDIYNSSSNIWYTATLSIARWDLTSSTVYNLAIFAGGMNGSYIFSQVDIYNYSSNSWFTATLSQARYKLASTTIRNLVMIAGGKYQFYFPSKQVDIYNYSSHSWFTTTLSIARWDLAATTVGDIALFAGGENDLIVFQKVDIYNYSSNLWTTATLSKARADITATSIYNLAMIVGGEFCNQDVCETSNLIDIYNYTSNSWYNATLSIARSHLAATTISNLAIFAGGVVHENGLASPQIDIFYYNNQSWIPTKCPEGHSLNKTGNFINCNFCQKGYYLSNNENCVKCEEGTYSAEVHRNNFCIPCSKGTYSNVKGATSASVCISCPFGKTSYSGSSYCHLDNIIIIIFCVVITFVIILIIITTYNFIKRRKYQNYIELISKEWNQIENIEIQEHLGKGRFGDVYKGIWNGTTEVALKCLNSKELEEFSVEADILQSINHPNIVRLFGKFEDKKTKKQYIVMEYLSKGSLDVLLKRQKNSLTIIDLIAISKYIAAGMEYLEEKNIIHCDLALRNLLAAPHDKDKYSVKITDFGLSYSKKIISKNNGNMIPVRWCAPEIFKEKKFSSKSDVWSFGIVLWELFSLGKTPYPGMSNKEVIENILSGYQMPKPEQCPDEIYELILQCWQFKPELRPTFKEIYNEISNIYEKFKKNEPDNSSLIQNIEIIIPTTNNYYMKTP